MTFRSKGLKETSAEKQYFAQGQIKNRSLREIPSFFLCSYFPVFGYFSRSGLSLLIVTRCAFCF